MSTLVRAKQRDLGVLPASRAVAGPIEGRDARASGAGVMPILDDGASVRAEAIRALRTHIVATHINGGRRALAICAASEGVGCTFVASNLAVALGQVGIRTLLIDANLRSPAIHKVLPSAASDVGLRQYLSSSDASVTDCIQADVLPNLSVMYSGGTATNPQELLAGERFGALVEECLRDFDATIVDTPPANQCADARRVSNVIGYSLIVARQNSSLVGDVKILLNELQSNHAHVVGTVLNEF